MINDQTDKLGAPDIQLASLKIWVHGRQYPRAVDYWDGNWVLVTAECELRGAWVPVSGPIIHLSELAQWAADAERLHRELNGEANLNCIEPELSIKLKANKLGQIEMTVDITPDHLSETHCFRFELDQSYLPDLILFCKTVLDLYPVRHR